MAVAVGIATHVVINTMLSHCESATYTKCHGRYNPVIWRGALEEAVYLLLSRTNGKLMNNLKQDKFNLGKNNTIFTHCGSLSRRYSTIMF